MQLNIVTDMEWEKEDFQKLLEGDSTMFSRLYKEYYTVVYNFLLVKTRGNKEVAEDLFSLTFMQAYQSINKLKNSHYIQPWLFKIAKNKFIDHTRSVKCESKYQDLLHHQVKNNTASDTLDIIMEKEKSVIYNSALNNVKPKYKELIIFKYIDRKSQKEIAKIINKNIRETEGLLYRARKALINEIKKSYQN